MSTYVFISYFHEDADVIRLLTSKLSTLGVDYWIDERGLEAGEQWRNKITRKIHSASVFLLCLSKQYYQRPNSYVHVEIAIALEKARIIDPSVTWIVPILIDNSPIPDLTIAEQRRLKDIQVTRIRPRGDQKAVDDCARRIKRVLEDPGFISGSIVINTQRLGTVQGQLVILDEQAVNQLAQLSYPYFDWAKRYAILDGRNTKPLLGNIVSAKGAWMPLEHYWKEYETWYFSEKRTKNLAIDNNPIRSAATLAPFSVFRFHVSPGRLRFIVWDANIEPMYQNTSSYTGNFYAYEPSLRNASDLVDVHIEARQSQIFSLQKTQSRGLFWRLRDTEAEFTIREVEAQ